MWDVAKGKKGDEKPDVVKKPKREEKPKEALILEDDLKKVYAEMGDIYKRIIDEIGKVIVGQKEVIEQILVAIFTDKHVLLEGFPGLGKTMIVRTLADIMDMDFKRIQCTPDLMPSDVTGTYIVEDDETGKKVFRFEEGPVFTNILLADEINRATPKAQSSLLESMQERQVTVGNETYHLDKPFLVLATQNPIEMEGTYPLPEAQVDRFLLKILVDYPNEDEEERIVKLYAGEKTPEVRKVVTKKEILAIQELTKKMPISDDMRKYALKIVNRTRPHENGVAKKYLDYGASPRAAIGLVLAAKAKALINGRNFVSEEDVTTMAPAVLRHRLILNFESERKGVTPDHVIAEIIKGI